VAYHISRLEVFAHAEDEDDDEHLWARSYRVLQFLYKKCRLTAPLL